MNEFDLRGRRPSRPRTTTVVSVLQLEARMLLAGVDTLPFNAFFGKGVPPNHTFFVNDAGGIAINGKANPYIKTARPTFLVTVSEGTILDPKNRPAGAEL